MYAASDIYVPPRPDDGWGEGLIVNWAARDRNRSDSDNVIGFNKMNRAQSGGGLGMREQPQRQSHREHFSSRPSDWSRYSQGFSERGPVMNQLTRHPDNPSWNNEYYTMPVNPAPDNWGGHPRNYAWNYTSHSKQDFNGVDWDSRPPMYASGAPWLAPPSGEEKPYGSANPRLTEKGYFISPNPYKMLEYNDYSVRPTGQTSTLARDRSVAGVTDIISKRLGPFGAQKKEGFSGNADISTSSTSSGDKCDCATKKDFIMILIIFVALFIVAQVLSVVFLSKSLKQSGVIAPVAPPLST